MAEQGKERKRGGKRIMKRFFIVCCIVAVVSAIAFAVSVAFLGVRDNNWGLSIGTVNLPFKISAESSRAEFIDGADVTTYDILVAGQEYSKTFSSDPDSIELNIMSCSAKIICSGGDKTIVKYYAGSSEQGLRAKLSDGKLLVAETSKPTFKLFSFGNFTQDARIEIYLPEKRYDDVNITAMSGNCTVDGLICESFTSEAMSGKSEFNIFAEEISVSSASGSQTLRCCNGQRARKITLKSASGSREAEFLADEWDIDSASGSTRITGIGGSLRADTASGSITLVYTEWGGDIDVSAASGSTEIVLPEGSGAEIDYERASGKLEVDLDGESMSFSSNTKTKLGGSNVHRITVKAVTGRVSGHN